MFGATGRTGELVVERLVAQGTPVRAFGRRAVTYESHLVTSHRNDVTTSTADELAVLLDGADAVVFVAGGDPERVDRDGCLIAVAAAERARARRFVLVTGMGVGRSRPPELYGGFWDRYFGAKETAERFLRASSLEWTILQPGELRDAPAAGRMTVGLTGSLPFRAISRADVAHAITTVLDHRGSIGQTWELIGGGSPVREALDQARRSEVTHEGTQR